MCEEVQNTRHAFHNQKVSMKHGLQPINRNMNKLLWRWPHACYAPTDGVCFLLLRSSCPRIWNHQTRRNWRNTLRHDEWEMMPRRQRCFLESLFRLKMWNLWEPFGSLILVMQSLALVKIPRRMQQTTHQMLDRHISVSPWGNCLPCAYYLNLLSTNHPCR